MKRREFISTLSVLTGGLSLSYGNIASNSIADELITFGISTDIHNDIIHDGEVRLKYYLAEMASRNVDFIIDLGDFCHPVDDSKKFAELWKASPLEKYNVLGNHDMDLGTKTEFMQFVGMEERYYSFDKGKFHFIVLDLNNLKVGEEYMPYANANFYVPSWQRAFIDTEQLEWLKRDLERTNKYSIIFSHQSLDEDESGNAGEVRRILEEANKKAEFRKVIMSINGHNHMDYHREINGIYYVQINSMSYKWVGDKYKSRSRFPEEVNRRRPNLEKTIPFTDPLYACVTIGNGKIVIDGVKSTFIKPGPDELGMDLTRMSNPFTAEISNRKLKY